MSKLIEVRELRDLLPKIAEKAARENHHSIDAENILTSVLEKYL